MKTRTILPVLVLALLAWLPGGALADTDTTSRPSFAASNYTKTAFGETFKATSGIQQRYTFAGREASANSAAPMFYRNRMYSANLGRFGRRDPVLGGDSLYNAYGFPSSNPVTNGDPMGEDILRYQDSTLGKKQVTKVFYTPEGFCGLNADEFYVGYIAKDDPNYIVIGHHPQATWLPVKVSKAKVESIADEWFSGIKRPDDLTHKLGVWQNQNVVNPVGFWTSLVPIYGSFRLAEYEAERGGGAANVGGYMALMATDVFLVRSLVTGVARAGFRGLVRVPAAMRIGFTSKWQPFHVIWRVKGVPYHAIDTGKGFFALRVVSATSPATGRALVRNTFYKYSPRLPIIAPKLSTITGNTAWFCWSAAITALSRGNLHIVPLVVPKLRLEGDKAKTFDIPDDASGYPSHQYNPDTQKWEPLELYVEPAGFLIEPAEAPASQQYLCEES